MNRGFSLVELSIVLVILGLLTGGILAGQSLIRAAELRSVTTQANQYLSIVYTFRDKYFSLPGDMTNATSFWGPADGTTGLTAGCFTTDSRSLADPRNTCNGTGDGLVGRNSAQYYEMFRFWQHLANAGLIEGSYSGITDTGTTLDSTPGFNAPRGRVGNSCFSVMAFDAAATNFLDITQLSGKNLFYFGDERPGNCALPNMTPAEAWNLDTKLDDGRPATGKVINFRSDYGVTPNCTDGTTASANYNLISSSKLCGTVLVPGI